MLSILAQQATASPESPQLDTFLKYGQMGLALAILVVGAGLFTAAVKQQNLSETTARVLKLFATVMVVLFVVSFLGEMAKTVMDHLEKQTAALDKRGEFIAAIELPPLKRIIKNTAQSKLRSTIWLRRMRPNRLTRIGYGSFPSMTKRYSVLIWEI